MKTKVNVRHPKFLALHGAVIVGALLIPLYMKLTSWLGGILAIA